MHITTSSTNTHIALKRNLAFGSKQYIKPGDFQNILHPQDSMTSDSFRHQRSPENQVAPEFSRTGLQAPLTKDRSTPPLDKGAELLLALKGPERGQESAADSCPVLPDASRQGIDLPSIGSTVTTYPAPLAGPPRIQKPWKQMRNPATPQEATEASTSSNVKEPIAGADLLSFLDAANLLKSTPRNNTVSQPDQEVPSIATVAQTISSPKAGVRTFSTLSSDDEDEIISFKPTKNPARKRRIMSPENSDSEEVALLPAPSIGKPFAKLTGEEKYAFKGFIKAIDRNRKSEVEKILKQYPQFLNQGNEEGITPLMTAADAAWPDLVRFFLGQPGILPNQKSHGRYTAIMWPDYKDAKDSKQRYIETLEAFMDHLATHPGSIDLSLRNQEGRRASDHVSKNIRPDRFTPTQIEKLNVIFQTMKSLEPEQ